MNSGFKVWKLRLLEEVIIVMNLWVIRTGEVDGSVLRIDPSAEIEVTRRHDLLLLLLHYSLCLSVSAALSALCSSQSQQSAVSSVTDTRGKKK